MKYPDFLGDNGVIGFVAPSFGCATEPYKTAFMNAIDKFKHMGFGVDLGPNCFVDLGIGISNTPQACAEELNSSYCSEKNDILISCGGGELMCEVIPYMDFERLKRAKPKWYMGYSDNTNFTFLATTICDTAAIYGPCAAAFGMEPWHESLEDALELLRGNKTTFHNYAMWEKESLKDEEHPLEPFHVTEPVVLHKFVGDGKPMGTNTKEAESVHMEGRLLGGCLDCLSVLCGTKYDRVKEYVEKYKDDGILWFLEACDLNMMSLRRVMWQLENAGWFRYTKGFLIGRPLHFGENLMGLDQYKATYDVISHYRVPIIMDADLGHLPPAVPLIGGSMATIEAKGNRWQIEMRTE